MGNKGRKPRKLRHSQHLAKVGTATENDRLLHEERAAVLDQMGVGNAPRGVKTAVIAVVVVLFIGAICGLLALFALR